MEQLDPRRDRVPHRRGAPTRSSSTMIGERLLGPAPGTQDARMSDVHDDPVRRSTSTSPPSRSTAPTSQRVQPGDAGRLRARCGSGAAPTTTSGSSCCRQTVSAAFSTGVDRVDGRFRHPNPYSEDDPGAVPRRQAEPRVEAAHLRGARHGRRRSVLLAQRSRRGHLHRGHRRSSTRTRRTGWSSALEPIGLMRRIPFGEVMRIALFGLDERMSAAPRARDRPGDRGRADAGAARPGPHSRGPAGGEATARDPRHREGDVGLDAR